MRPRGEIREALCLAAVQFGQDGFTWRDLAHAACVGFDAAKRTVGNMARAGELVVLDEVRVPGANRPMLRYVPAVIGDDALKAVGGTPGAELAAIVHCWADFK